MQFLQSYGLFLLQAATIVVAILLILAGMVGILSKNKSSPSGKISIKKLNDRYLKMQLKFAEATQQKKAFKKLKHEHKKAEKKSSEKHRLFVIDFNGDIKASAVNALREEVTAILLAAKINDECLVRLESGGGLVNAYGLAASQLDRLKAAGIKLTIAIDKIAASGGYMMACVADHLVAAPFAVVGSIGVIAQLPNFHRYLEKKNIDFEQLTAGQYKRTLTMFGENTKAGRLKLQEDINDTHELFKEFIHQHRPSVDLNQVATGEHWFATRAVHFNLVDALETSDNLLLKAKNDFLIYQVQYQMKKPLMKRIGSGIENTLLNLMRGKIIDA